MKKEFIVFLLVLVLSFIGVFGPVWYHLTQNPAGTTFPYADGWLPDYYQYLSWIRDGMDGDLLVNTSYTEKTSLKLPIQIYYPIIGFFGRLIGIQEAYQIHLLGRIISLSILLGTFWWASKKLYTKSFDRILALICLLTTTGFWWLSQGKLVEPITWSGNFNVIGKFGMPPHHALAVALLLVSGWLISLARSPLARLVLIPIVIGFLNPSILTFAVLIWGGCFLIDAITAHSREIPRQARNDKVILILISLPILLYHFWVFQNIEPWSVMYMKMKAFNPPTSFWQYFLSLGPVGWVGLASVSSWLVVCGLWKTHRNINYELRTSNYKLQTFLILWAFIPIILFPFAGNLLPINISRLFQSYQFIPLALLAPMGIELVKMSLRAGSNDTMSNPSRLLKFMIVIFLILYASVPYYFTLKSNLLAYSTSWYNMYLPDDFMAALKYLRENTPPESVVVSGENVSLMIPAFTHNRTLIARDDIRLDYYQVRNQVFALVDGRMSEAEARQFLSERGVKYVLFGLDTKPYSTLPSLQPLFSPIFTSGTVTVVEVKN